MNKSIAYKLRVVSLAIAALAVLFASGCSVTPKVDPDVAYEPPKHKAENYIKESVVYAADVYDPWEGFNRRAYTFNYYFDKFLYLPIVRTYEFITPNYVEKRVSNFVDNVFEFNNFTNNLLQLKLKRTGITLARFLINTTVGIAGLWDPATGWGYMDLAAAYLHKDDYFEGTVAPEPADSPHCMGSLSDRPASSP